MAFAVIGEDVGFTGSRHVYVDGTRLGRVPRLAIGFEPFNNEFLIFHCDAKWNCLGTSGGGRTMGEARASIERAYPGVRWTETPRTRDEAIQTVRDYWRGRECSSCGRVPPQFQSSLEREGGTRICNICLAASHEAGADAENSK